MKSFLLSLVAVFALAQLAQADVTVKITKVHLCCGKCVAGAKKAVSTVDGCTADIDKTNQTVSITASDAATVQKAVDALTKAGFFGETDSTDIKIDASTGAAGSKVQSLKVAGVHLCCPNCVKAVHAAVIKVPGVTGENAEKGAESFVITGDFNDADIFAALQKAGLTGKVSN
jgi:periplasmic mercuric ion binding protein